MPTPVAKIVFSALAGATAAALIGSLAYDQSVPGARRRPAALHGQEREEWADFAPQPATGAARSFALRDAAEQEVSLAAFRGRWVLVNFWATWCPSCLEELPSLIRLARHLADRSVAVLAVSLDDGWRPVQKVLEHLADGGAAPLIVLLDQEGRTAEAYGTRKLPESYLVDPEGRLRAKFIGPQDWWTPAAQAYFRSTLANASGP